MKKLLAFLLLASCSDKAQDFVPNGKIYRDWIRETQVFDHRSILIGRNDSTFMVNVFSDGSNVEDYVMIRNDSIIPIPLNEFGELYIIRGPILEHHSSNGYFDKSFPND